MLGRDMAPARAGRPDNTSLTAWGRRLGDARPERFDDASSAPQPRTADTSRAPLEATLFRAARSVPRRRLRISRRAPNYILTLPSRGARVQGW